MSPNQLACGHQGESRCYFDCFLMSSSPLDQLPPFVFLNHALILSSLVFVDCHFWVSIMITPFTKLSPSPPHCLDELLKCLFRLAHSLLPVPSLQFFVAHATFTDTTPRRSSITRLSQQEKVHSTREITAKVHLLKTH